MNTVTLPDYVLHLIDEGCTVKKNAYSKNEYNITLANGDKKTLRRGWKGDDFNYYIYNTDNFSPNGRILSEPIIVAHY